MFNPKLLVLLLLVFALDLKAQPDSLNTYVVYFKDKDTASFNPHDFFDTKAIIRRRRSGVPLSSFNDVPVNSAYINGLSLRGCEVVMVSRWLNAAFIITDEVTRNQVRNFPFVKQINLYQKPQKHISSANEAMKDKKPFVELMKYQTARFQADVFKQKNLTGKGIRIAVFDVGFNGADKHEAFEHMRKNNQIKATYDFIKKTDNVYHGGSHGTQTLSCIGGRMMADNLGMATDAEFLLARTEYGLRENIAEEYFWLAAAEWADKNGADIISSSLGYGETWYEVGDMNGKKSIVSFAATTAAQKGILVVNSAGNEFASEWKLIITPADANSVLCVGGTNPSTDRHIGFSSCGPSADFRIKPNVSAPGHVFAANPKNYADVQGTSFSCPLVAGFAACAWQNDTSLTNMKLFKAIEQSGHLYPYFDYMHGYGIPQASLFINKNREDSKKLFQVNDIDSSGYHNIKINITDSALLKNITDAKSSGRAFNFYWNVQAPDGILKQYEVIAISSSGSFNLNSNRIQPGDTVNMHFEGYTYSRKIQ